MQLRMISTDGDDTARGKKLVFFFLISRKRDTHSERNGGRRRGKGQRNSVQKTPTRRVNGNPIVLFDVANRVSRTRFAAVR